MAELENSLPKELTNTFNSLDYQEDGGLVITAIKSTSEILQVDFTLAFIGIDRPQQFWRIDISGAKKERIVFEWATELKIYSDHYLLYEFTDNYIELYLGSQPGNPIQIFLDLYDLHRNHFNKIDIHEYLNSPEGIPALCQKNNALFACGPKKIIKKYEECLIKNGSKTTMINEHDKENENCKLLIFGESYFIGEEFSFKQLS